MNKVIGYIFGEFFAGYIKKIIYIGLITSAFIAIVAMWSSFAIAFIYFINHVQILLDMVTSFGSSSSSGSNILCKFIGVLEILGFYDAFYDSKSVWLSGLTFIAGRILMIQTISAYLSLIALLKPLLTK